MLNDLLNKVGGPRRAAIGAVGIGAAVLILVISRVATAPTMVPAVTGVPLQSTSALTEKLESAGIKYSLDQGGATILVAQTDLARARVTLAKDGIPGGNRPGMEIFDRPSWGWNDFTQRVNYRRALEGELERTIGRMRGIERAEVHIAISEQGGFRAVAERPATASVLIALKESTNPSPEVVQGIQHLVSSSVDGLSTDNVSIHDETGRQFSEAGEGSVAGLTSRQLRMQQEVERNLERKASEMVSQVVGAGNSRVQVSANMNFDKIERTTQSVDPEKQALTNETKAEIVPGAQGGAGSTNVSNSYENTKSTELYSSQGGTIKRLTVAVLVADKLIPSTGPTDTIPRTQPRTPAEIAALETLVRSAIGADSTRGDAVSVVSMPMASQKVVAAAPTPVGLAEKIEPYQRSIATGAGLLLVAVIAMMAIRALKTPAAPQLAQAPMQLAVAGAESTGGMMLPSTNTQERTVLPQIPAYSFPVADTQIRDRVIQSVDENPDAAARLVKAWMKEG